MKKSRGFTIVEIAVVVTIIATITTIVIVMFVQVQKQARDKRRSSDMTVLMSALEKYYDTYGEYPTDDTLATKISAGQVSGLITQSAMASPLIVGPATTHAILKSKLAPNADNDLGDPLRSTPDTMFNSSSLTATDGANFQYFYIGGGDFNGNGTVSGFSTTFNAPSPTGSFACTYTYTATANGAASYIIGFFNESTKAFTLYKGRQGTPINWNTSSEGRCPTPLQGN